MSGFQQMAITGSNSPGPSTSSDKVVATSQMNNENLIIIAFVFVPIFGIMFLETKQHVSIQDSLYVEFYN